MPKTKTICHPEHLEDLSSTNSYSTNDGSFVGGTLTKWCAICGSVYTYRNEGGRYSSLWKVIKVKTPLQA